ncbi:hypothetical protein NX059_002742 [Plenodomus lindquistii]|nr:hypothetical protein NX059_002742 [Plenodomus lindquistii]
MPSTQLFGDYPWQVMETLKKMATEAERTAGDFRRDKPQLARNKQYYRFNVLRGLENIGLEWTKKSDQMASATRVYLNSEDVRNHISEIVGKADSQITTSE